RNVSGRVRKAQYYRVRLERLRPCRRQREATGVVTTESRLTTETPPVFGENAKNVTTPAWFAKYRYAIFVTDLVVIVAALFVAQRARFGTVDGHIMAGPVQVDYAVAGLVIELIWVLALTASESRSMRVIGAGLDEYRKVINTTFATFGLIAVC